MIQIYHLEYKFQEITIILFKIAFIKSKRGAKSQKISNGWQNKIVNCQVNPVEYKMMLDDRLTVTGVLFS